jgi:hypothetical protein
MQASFTFSAMVGMGTRVMCITFLKPFLPFSKAFVAFV